jgi:L-aspartate oxidase
VAEQRFDLVVVGSGAAGLSAARRAAELGARVAMLTAGAPLAGSSPRAQGGVAAAVGADDAPALHAADTLAVGGGLNDRAAVAVLTAEGTDSVRRLIDDGVPFDDDLGLEAGHARRRILHAGGAATGHILTSALLEQVVEDERITLFAHTRADALLTRRGRVVGVHSGARTFGAPATVLATGGYAALWGRTTNATESRGTGLVLAYLAGASLADLEFVQFHPTALCLPGQPAFLLSEALRGEGARLLDAAGQDVVDPLLPRDVVARALHRHLRTRGAVFLSLRHLDAAHVRGRFPSLVGRLAELGLDLARDPLPVAPAAHYCMGGIRTDTWGRTDVGGLYAAGESACTGVQGANRLASNSLLECLVFGARAAQAALTDGPDTQAAWATRALPAGADMPSGSQRLSAIDAAVLGARLDVDLGVERDARRLGRLIADLPEVELGDARGWDWLSSFGPDALGPFGAAAPSPRGQANGNQQGYSGKSRHGPETSSHGRAGVRWASPHGWSHTSNESAADRTTPAANRPRPAADRATPAADRTTPAADRAMPAADRTVQAADRTSLAEDRAMRTADPTTPAADRTTPAEDRAMRTADPTTPAADRTTPEADRTTPAADRTSPAEDRAMRTADPTTPAADRTTPEANRTTPAADRATPAADRTTPAANRTARTADRGGHGASRNDLSSAPDLLLAALVARAALLRQESRGAHFRTDVPAASDAWRGRIHWRRAQGPKFEEVLPQ